MHDPEFESWQSKIFFSSMNCPHQPCVTPSHLLNGFIKQLMCDVDHSPPSSADVKNEWCCTSVCLDGVDRDNFTYTFMMLDRSMLFEPIK
jgi:hypothetical protein